MSNLRDILLSDKYKIPHDYSANSNFRTYILGKLTAFKDDISVWHQKQLTSMPLSIKKKEYEVYNSKLINIILRLKDSLNEYYNGNPHKSYEVYKEVLDELNKSKSVLSPKNLNRDNPIYRMRVGKKEDVKERKNIFHVPFDKRTKISVQRYSIAGYPSLYLANSTYVAWEELGRPSLDEVFFARFELRFDTLFLNFSSEDYYDDISKLEEYSSSGSCLLDKMLLFPILFICSIQVANRDDPFKPEYIFPQFTLRWCREQDKFKGIVYRSTRINKKSIGKFYNVVMPVIFKCIDENVEPPHCTDLASTLNMTQPYNIQAIELTSKSTDTNITEIYSKELASNIKFKDSIFSKIEGFLKNQSSDIIT
jgi:hypothetical protein